MNEQEIIVLYDEDGNPSEYELIDLFELNGSVYGGFAPLLEDGEEDADELEIVMMKVIEDGEEEMFAEIEDEEEELEAFNELVRRDEDDE